MRLRLSAANCRSLAALLMLAAITLGAVVPGQAAAAAKIGVGPAECVAAAPSSECGQARPVGQPAVGSANATSHPTRLGLADTQTDGSGAGESDAGNEAPTPSGVEPFRFFSPTSFWNTPLSADAPLDQSSPGVVASFLAEIEREKSAQRDPTINTRRWSVPIYTVPADQPTVHVNHNNGGSSRALQAAWTAVPLPSNAQPAAGTDAHLVVWQPSANRLWEFWRLSQGSGGWQAPWGGAMENVSSSQGVYGPESWPGATSQWGGSACSLSLAGGLITLEDLEMGEINHALAIGIPDVRAGVFALPAQRTDGRSLDPLSLPEGARLRLDPNLDLAALNLPPLALLIATAAQRYGLIVRSLGSHVVFYGEDPTPTGSDPYKGKHGYFEGQEPSQLLSSFPWERLQLLQMTLGLHS